MSIGAIYDILSTSVTSVLQVYDNCKVGEWIVTGKHILAYELIELLKNTRQYIALDVHEDCAFLKFQRGDYLKVEMGTDFYKDLMKLIPKDLYG